MLSSGSVTFYWTLCSKNIWLYCISLNFLHRDTVPLTAHFPTIFTLEWLRLVSASLQLYSILIQHSCSRLLFFLLALWLAASYLSLLKSQSGRPAVPTILRQKAASRNVKCHLTWMLLNVRVTAHNVSVLKRKRHIRYDIWSTNHCWPAFLWRKKLNLKFVFINVNVRQRHCTKLAYN
jgi:hypothetical protein